MSFLDLASHVSAWSADEVRDFLAFEVLADEERRHLKDLAACLERVL